MTDSSSSEASSELLSVAQTAQLLGISRQRVHDLIKNGQIVACKLGQYYYIKWSSGCQKKMTHIQSCGS